MITNEKGFIKHVWVPTVVILVILAIIGLSWWSVSNSDHHSKQILDSDKKHSSQDNQTQ